MTGHGHTKLALAFCVLAAWSVALVFTIQMRTDLGFYLPRSTSPDVQLLIDKLRDGPAANLIIIGLSGGAQKDLAELSANMSVALEESGNFRFVSNGGASADPAVAKFLLQYRYLLDPAIAEEDFGASSMREDLTAWIETLGTGAGAATANLLPRDPTRRLSKILAHWTGGNAGNRKFGVWFSAKGDTALLLVQTVAGGFDFPAQKQTQDHILETFRSLAKTGDTKIEMTGPAVFAQRSSEEIKRELRLLTILSGGIVTGLLFFLFRSLPAIFVITLPLAGGILAAITAVQLVFGSIHGISLTFGITLIGVAIDYPVHVASHVSGGSGLDAAVRRVWPTLRLGALTTVAAFIPLALSSFPGLSQMGLFAIVGLVVAAGITRWVVPSVAPFENRFAGPETLATWLAGNRVFRFLRPIALALAALALVSLVSESQQLFDDDLANMSPISPQAKKLDRELRAEAGAPDVRYLIVVEGQSLEEVLQTEEELEPVLARMIADGVLASYNAGSKYLPSVRSQAARLAAIPDQAGLRATMAEARAGLPFRDGAFEPFFKDIEDTRAAKPLVLASFQDADLGWVVEPLLSRTGEKWVGLITPSGLSAPQRLGAEVSKFGPGVRFFDLKAESQNLVSNYRRETLILLAWGFVALAVVLGPGLRSLRGLFRVVTPVAIAVALTTWLLLLSGGGLNIFHLCSLMLVVGLGLDYALFFYRFFGERQDRQRTLRAVLVCNATTISVFAVLALSSLPVLHGIGLTVTIGSILCLILTPMFAIRAHHE